MQNFENVYEHLVWEHWDFLYMRTLLRHFIWELHWDFLYEIFIETGWHRHMLWAGCRLSPICSRLPKAGHTKFANCGFLFRKRWPTWALEEGVEWGEGCFLGGCRVGAGVRKEPELQYSVHLSLHLTPGIQSRIGEQCNSAGWRSRWRCSAVQLQKPVQKYHQRRPPDALTARHYRCCSQYPAKPHLLRPSLLITASGFVHSTRWLMWQMPIGEAFMGQKEGHQLSFSCAFMGALEVILR